MNGYEFTANIINSLIWPITICITLYIFRNELSVIVRSLTKLRYKELELELEFEKSAQDIVSKAKLSLPEASENIQFSGHSKCELVEHLTSTSELAPRSAILEAWLVVETAAVDVVRKQGIDIQKISRSNTVERLSC